MALPLPLRRFPTHAACGVCGRSALPQAEEPPQRKGEPLFSQALFPQLSAHVRAAQKVFEATGGLHAAALFTADGALHCLREDIGRHNARELRAGAESRPRRCCATYFPEANVLIPLRSHADKSKTPTSKSVVVRLHKLTSLPEKS
ncbi:formate dehydrogenase accessory sulfurtransferase FdhD [Armatimonas sp.]|uniref:formate dehydrogenase accessory sulfurtransferase FdhD n=1 Tax=Armatimonas sp. TaxID=1872638 RepID=UPI003751E2A6